MPIVTAANDLAAILENELQTGGAARASLGAPATAFAWTTGLPVTLANYVNSAVTESLSFSATRVTPSGTPVKVVAAGAAKPAAVSIATSSVALKKYAGIATFNTEDLLSNTGLAGAVAATMTAGVVLSFESDLRAALLADAGATAAGGGSWTTAILGGIAAVAANGGAPGVLVIPAADYAAAVGAPGVGFAMSTTDAVVTLFGLQVCISPSGATGTGYVLDPAAVLVAQHASSPLAVADSYSGLSTNQLRLAVEAFLGCYVTAPASVCKITKA